jgi:predicted TIM-barrel fold metal-dependent hydrolase
LHAAKSDEKRMPTHYCERILDDDMSEGPPKRFDGRDETILEPDLSIIDSHHHFFDLPHMKYMFDDYLSDVYAGHNVVASTYVATQSMIRADGPELLRPLGEIEFANGVAAMSASGNYGPCRVCAAIVGFADLTVGDQVADLLERCMATASDRFRGVRQTTLDAPNESIFRFVMSSAPPVQGVLKHPSFPLGFRHLGPRGLTFDASIFHHQADDLAALADSFPDTTIVLNHMGIALGMDLNDDQRAAVFQQWRLSIGRIAERDNIVCKIGGLGMPFWGLGFETRRDPVGSPELARAWAPWIETAIETFGPSRCMMESNYPPDGRSSGFVPLWNALKRVVRTYSSEEKDELFHGTAARIYKIDAPSVSP